MRTMAKKYYLLMDESQTLWRRFDAILKREGYTTRAAAFRHILRSITKRGKLPPR